MRIACFGGYSDNAGKWVVIGSFLLGQFRMVLFAILRNLNGLFNLFLSNFIIACVFHEIGYSKQNQVHHFDVHG